MKQMPRFEIAGDPVSVAYGYDENNVFLSCFDKRLKFDPDAPDQVNAVTHGRYWVWGWWRLLLRTSHGGVWLRGES